MRKEVHVILPNPSEGAKRNFSLVSGWHSGGGSSPHPGPVGAFTSVDPWTLLLLWLIAHSVGWVSAFPTYHIA